MTTGIYSLTFGKLPNIYVGQSIDIERRYKEHLTYLKSNTHSFKVTEAYARYGIPNLSILCLCDKSNLDLYEDIFISYYNSHIDGLNTLSSSSDMPKPDNRGINHGLSKYSKEQLIEVLLLLIEQPFEKYEDIAEVTSVNYQTIANIASLAEHKWLNEAYPSEYNKLSSFKGIRNFGRESNTAKIKGITYPAVVSPTGEVFYTIDNVVKFMKEHNIKSKTFYELLNNKKDTVCGWRRL